MVLKVKKRGGRGRGQSLGGFGTHGLQGVSLGFYKSQTMDIFMVFAKL